MHIRSLVLGIVLLALMTLSVPTSTAQEFPLQEDVSTIDGIMKAYYEVVSGPAGQPAEVERDRSLHHPDARLLVLRDDGDGGVTVDILSIDEYHEGLKDRLRTAGFFEYEITRREHFHGANALIWTTYEWRTDMDGPIGGTGINSVQLYNDGARWWVISEMWDSRPDAPPVPDEYMPKQ